MLKLSEKLAKLRAKFPSLDEAEATECLEINSGDLTATMEAIEKNNGRIPRAWKTKSSKPKPKADGEQRNGTADSKPTRGPKENSWKTDAPKPATNGKHVDPKAPAKAEAPAKAAPKAPASKAPAKELPPTISKLSFADMVRGKKEEPPAAAVSAAKEAPKLAESSPANNKKDGKDKKWGKPEKEASPAKAKEEPKAAAAPADKAPKVEQPAPASEDKKKPRRDDREVSKGVQDRAVRNAPSKNDTKATAPPRMHDPTDPDDPRNKPDATKDPVVTTTPSSQTGREVVGSAWKPAVEPPLLRTVAPEQPPKMTVPAQQHPHQHTNHHHSSHSSSHHQVAPQPPAPAAAAPQQVQQQPQQQQQSTPPQMPIRGPPPAITEGEVTPFELQKEAVAIPEVFKKFCGSKFTFKFVESEVAQSSPAQAIAPTFSRDEARPLGYGNSRPQQFRTQQSTWAESQPAFRDANGWTAPASSGSRYGTSSSAIGTSRSWGTSGSGSGSTGYSGSYGQSSYGGSSQQQQQQFAYSGNLMKDAGMAEGAYQSIRSGERSFQQPPRMPWN